MRERIINAAIRYSGIVFVADTPNGRHSTVISAMHMANINTIEMAGPDNQGFITNTGRFVDRVEALEIAVTADQIIEGRRLSRELFSEDVW